MAQTVRILITLFALFSSKLNWAQDTLPRFTVTTPGNNKIIISWTNNYNSVSQISIQRSYDSTKNFQTLLTVPDPRVKQNGFVDAKAPTPFMFYRLFIVLEGGSYVFSKSKRAVWDTSRTATSTQPANNQPANGNKRVLVSDKIDRADADEIKEKLKEEARAEPEKYVHVKKGDAIIAVISEKQLRRFRDSIVYRTKDTLVFSSIDTIVIKEAYKPSRYIYTDRDGNVTVALPETNTRKFAIKFYEDDNTPLFEIKLVKDSPLTLDKVNFLHSGWFRFELYEDGRLKEKHRVYIPKD